MLFHTVIRYQMLCALVAGVSAGCSGDRITVTLSPPGPCENPDESPCGFRTLGCLQRLHILVFGDEEQILAERCVEVPEAEAGLERSLCEHDLDGLIAETIPSGAQRVEVWGYGPGASQECGGDNPPVFVGQGLYTKGQVSLGLDTRCALACESIGDIPEFSFVVRDATNRAPPEGVGGFGLEVGLLYDLFTFFNVVESGDVRFAPFASSLIDPSDPGAGVFTLETEAYGAYDAPGGCNGAIIHSGPAMPPQLVCVYPPEPDPDELTWIPPDVHDAVVGFLDANDHPGEGYFLGIVREAELPNPPIGGVTVEGVIEGADVLYPEFDGNWSLVNTVSGPDTGPQGVFVITGQGFVDQIGLEADGFFYQENGMALVPWAIGARVFYLEMDPG